MTTPPPPSPMSTPDPWDLVAPGYETDVLPLFENFASAALGLANLPPAAAVLDVAAGPGTLSLLAARTVRHVTAVDVSPDMLARLQRRAAAASLSNLSSQLANGQALPFADSAFDGAFSMFGLIFFPDRAQGFRELRRVLKPGGRAVVSSWVPFERMVFLVEAVRAIFRALAMPPAAPFTEVLSTHEAVHGEMRAAGFQDVSVHEATHAFEYPSTEAAWASLSRSTAPIALMRKRVGEEAWPRVFEAVRADLQDHFGTGPQRLPMTALLGMGTR